jgi:hypothetical protein
MFKANQDAFDQWLEEEKEQDEILDMLVDDLASSSDEEPSHWGGSTTGKAKNKDRNFFDAYSKLIKDYFNGTDSIYDESDFERRFRMPRSVFNELFDAINGHGSFKQRRDCVGKQGIHPLVRTVACLRHICYGGAYDREDENMRMGEETLRLSVKEFTRLVVKLFGKQYLNRSPSDEEKESILQANSARGFPGCFASWDCKHFVWHRCPMRWAGQHAGHAEGGKKTLILEALADVNRYIWYSNFGDAGSLNDLNVLDKSSIVGSMIDGTFDITCPSYSINGTRRDWMYFLVDGIYYDWAIFVKTYSEAIEEKTRLFAKRQEEVRKDVECAFGILVQKFHILAKPLRSWYLKDICCLLDCCVILHNMVIAARGGKDTVLSTEEAALEAEINMTKNKKWPLFGGSATADEVLAMDGVDIFAARSGMFSGKMASSREHFKLKNDLREHLFQNNPYD